MKTSVTAMFLAVAVLMAPVAQAATKAKTPVVKAQPAKTHKAQAPKLRKVSRNTRAEPMRGYVYSPRVAAVVAQPAIAGARPAKLPKPPPAPAIAQAQLVEGELTRISALMQQCHAAMPTAHPWRAAQANREMFQLKVSMSYRAAADRLSAQERASAAAIEARAYGNLAATCAPLLT